MKQHENHLPDGRHVATVCDDALRYLWRWGLADQDMIEHELARRPKRQARTVAKGYVHFGSGMRGRPNSEGAYNVKRPEKKDRERD
jgi:hypothetical protein